MHLFFIQQKDDQSKDLVSSNNKQGPEDLKQYFIDFLKLKREAEGEITQEELDNFDPSAQVEQESDEGFGDMDQKKEVPKYVSALKEVMGKYSQPYLYRHSIRHHSL